MIDKDGYRPNVGIVICNRKGQVLWARRIRQNSWQFPQGGVDYGETPEDAMYRELYEELGLEPNDVKLLASTKFWLKYRLPKRLIRWNEKPVCIGQKQKWYLLCLKKDITKWAGSNFINQRINQTILSLVAKDILNLMIGAG